jgi:flagellar motor component MotA
MILEGVISILEGMNPHMLETKLTGFFAEAKAGTDIPEDKAKAASA